MSCSRSWKFFAFSSFILKSFSLSITWYLLSRSVIFFIASFFSDIALFISVSVCLSLSSSLFVWSLKMFSLTSPFLLTILYLEFKESICSFNVLIVLLAARSLISFYPIVRYSYYFLLYNWAWRSLPLSSSFRRSSMFICKFFYFFYRFLIFSFSRAVSLLLCGSYPVSNLGFAYTFNFEIDRTFSALSSSILFFNLYTSS